MVEKKTAHLNGGDPCNPLRIMYMAAKHAPSENARTPSNGPSAKTYRSSSKRAFCADSGECGSKYEKYAPSGWESEAISD